MDGMGGPFSTSLFPLYFCCTPCRHGHTHTHEPIIAVRSRAGSVNARVAQDYGPGVLASSIRPGHNNWVMGIDAVDDDGVQIKPKVSVETAARRGVRLRWQGGTGAGPAFGQGPIQRRAAALSQAGQGGRLIAGCSFFFCARARTRALRPAPRAHTLMPVAFQPAPQPPRG